MSSTIRTTSASSASTPRPGRAIRRAAVIGLGVALPLVSAGAAFAAPQAPAQAAAAAATPKFRIALSTHALAFGAQNTGSSSALSVTLSNTGSKAVQPVQVLSGAAAFTLSGNTCASHPVKPGASCAY